MFFQSHTMTSITYAVRWIECTGNGDLECEQLFASEAEAISWLEDIECGVGPDGHPNASFFDHCGPRTIEPV